MAGASRTVVARAQCGCGCCPKLNNRRVWYDKLYAKLISRSTARFNELLNERKQTLLSTITDDSRVKDVLEIGIGSGANLPYYAATRKDINLTAVDPNTQMLPYLTAATAEQGFPASQLTFAQGVAEALPLDDESQDVVISTLVLCSVTDQRAALSEVLRVLRPGGSFLFVEHVAAPMGSWTRTMQEVVNPAWRFVADGCQVNRETWSTVRAAGFRSCDISHFKASESPLLSLLAPFISGRAIK
eukprot:GHUV01006883.1.p1 GENE.GHUV01006883.1~~GHUV01006883.1.p1  ORF type:complete len:244 (+),score=36.49 GHUV01006883.1:208-939(+)